MNIVDTNFDASLTYLQGRVMACNGVSSLDLMVMTAELMVKAFNESTLPVLADVWDMTADMARKNALEAATAQAWDMKDDDVVSVRVMDVYQTFRARLFRDHDKIDDFNAAVALVLQEKEAARQSRLKTQFRSVMESLPPSSEAEEVNKALGPLAATLCGGIMTQMFGIMRSIDTELSVAHMMVFEEQQTNRAMREEIGLYKNDIQQAHMYETKLKQKLVDEKRCHDDMMSKHGCEIQAIQASNDLLQQDMEALQAMHKERIQEVLHEVDVEHMERQAALDKATAFERDALDFQTRNNEMQQTHKKA